MTDHNLFPPLTGFEPTRQTLHLYAQAAGVLPRVHAEMHPKWWHVSLKVRDDGLYSEPMIMPDSRVLREKVDLLNHQVIMLVDESPAAEFDMTAGLTASAFGDQIIAAAADLGLSGEYERHRFENHDPRLYDPVMVSAFWQALTNANWIFAQFRDSLAGETGPINFWTHGFDLAFEWYGTRMVASGTGEQQTSYPAQINFGFYPGNPKDAPYFYSNPWPFEGDKLVDKPLPDGARWHTEGWQGTILPYEKLVGDPRAEERLLEYGRAVHQLARPLLLEK